MCITTFIFFPVVLVRTERFSYTTPSLNLVVNSSVKTIPWRSAETTKVQQNTKYIKVIATVRKSLRTLHAQDFLKYSWQCFVNR